MWVAVVDKKVVSSGHRIAKIKKIASKETGRLHIPVLFVEGSPHVYEEQRAFLEEVNPNPIGVLPNVRGE